MDVPKDLKYSREHEWVLVEEKIVTIGVTEYAQEQMGDVVFVELPEVGDVLTKDEAFGTIESVKAVSDIYSPVSGKVVETNTDLADSPEIVNEDPYGDAWIIRVEMEDPTDLDDLMAADEYQEFLDEEMDEELNEDEEEGFDDFEDDYDE